MHSQIRSYYLNANANANANAMLLIPILTVSLIKFDKKSCCAAQWHLKCTPAASSLETNQNNPPSAKEGRPSSAFCLEIVFGANRRAGVQLILVQGSSPPRIVLLWDPRGAGEGVCGPRGGAFTNTAAAENLNCKGGKNRVAWMADILG